MRSSAAYRKMDSDFGKKAFAECFRLFLDGKNYPVAFHCSAGQDRTGSLAFLLNGLPGVPEELLFQDWEATIFWNGNPAFGWRLIASLAGTLGNYPGKNINEKIEAYVLACGFTKDDVAKFRNEMLEVRK